MNKKTEISLIATGCVLVGVLLAANYAVISKLSSIEEKGEVIDQKLENLNERTEKIESLVYNSGVKLVISNKEKECLAKNIYHEAGIESKEGKIAVAQVTFNRLNTGRWGDDICSVVYARKQFSWTLSKVKRDEKPTGELWKKSVAARDSYLAGKRVKKLDSSKHYHTDYIKKPVWAKEKTVLAQIGQHIFYEN